MAFYQLKSTNPNLNALLRKVTGQMYIDDLKKGKLFSWMNDNNTFNMYFKDSEGENSFSNNEIYNYLDTSQYNAALCLNNAIFLMFRNILTELLPEDVDKKFYHEFFINLLHVHRKRYLDLFSYHFPEFEISTQEIASKDFQIKITSNSTIQRLIQFVGIFSIMIALTNKENIFVNDAVVEKYLKIIKAFDPPYFVRYIFKTNLLRTTELFNTFGESLVESDTNITLTYGNNHMARRNFVEEIFDFNHPILDVGCGEGYFLFRFSRKLANENYIGLDIDKEILSKVSMRIEAEGIKNITLFDSLDECIKELRNDKQYDVILSEVMEHMSKEAAKKLISRILTINIHKLIITTPNKDFNQYYFDDEDKTRHVDHKFEMTEIEFMKFIETIVDNKKFKIEFIKVGDIVENIATTNGVIVSQF